MTRGVKISKGGKLLQKFDPQGGLLIPAPVRKEFMDQGIDIFEVDIKEDGRIIFTPYTPQSVCIFCGDKANKKLFGKGVCDNHLNEMYSILKQKGMTK